MSTKPAGLQNAIHKRIHKFKNLPQLH